MRRESADTGWGPSTRPTTDGDGGSSTSAASQEAALPWSFYVEEGSSHPLGATPDKHGTNFSIFSEHATSVDLLLFDRHDAMAPMQIVHLDSSRHRTSNYWHCYVRGLRPGVHYAYRVDGAHNLHDGGHRFDPDKVLLDPYAKANTHNLWNRGDACGAGDNVATSMRSVVVDITDYDWEGDRPIHHPMSQTIIYEMHVRGFTKSSTSGCREPGTFAGVVEKIPYLKALGITAVELLPVFDFDETETDRVSPLGGSRLTNYWGYSTVSFFTPHHAYSGSPEEGTHIREFRDMVKALHRAGIEVILDVVFNHTSEGNHQGPVINFKGFDNSIYYYLEPQDKQYYHDYSGCGNTVNCNHPVVDKMILECLVFWVRQMHVDGFRFDEGSVLARGQDGEPMRYPPVIWHIDLSESLSDTKVIAEAWDAAGLYQVGYFPGYRWAEWNGRYRDTIRRFVRGDPGIVGDVASRISGSADIYQTSGHLPINSVNFVDCHDGFTLNDLVTYNEKHNEANGEDNRDGMENNLSWNCGYEGKTEDPEVEVLRERQIKNFLAILMLSEGVPMIVAGDEFRRTQRGNNNAYCQDNEISWIDWQLPEKHADLVRFFKLIVALRKRHPSLQRQRFFNGELNARGLPDVAWHGCLLECPGWQDPSSRVLAFTLGGLEDGADLHVMLNMDSADLWFQVPEAAGRRWYVAVNTAEPSPMDIAELGQEKQFEGEACLVQGHSVVVLVSREGGQSEQRKSSQDGKG